MFVHKLAYEAFMRLTVEGFFQWLEEFHPTESDQVQNYLSEIAALADTLTTEKHDEVFKSRAFKRFSELFDVYTVHLRKTNGPLSAFWMSYIDMIELLLHMIRASREGNWELHLSCVHQMLPWCFAYNAINYSRYMSVYYGDMMNLPNDHPEVHEFMQNGGFSVQMSKDNTFGRIPVDQTLEETVNKDTQTPGGTKGFSLNPGAVERYYITAEFRTLFLRNLRKMVGYAKGKHGHADLTASRISQDEKDVAAMVDLIKNWTNPFAGHTQLSSISTGAVATPAIAEDLANAYKIGEAAYCDFKETRLESQPPKVKFHDKLKKQNLKTFSALTKTKKVAKNKDTETVLRADRNFFGRIIILAESRNDLQMIDVLKHPLSPRPSSLACNNGFPRKTNKAQLGKELEKLIEATQEVPTPSAYLIDGMALVQKLKVDYLTFGEIADKILSRVMQEGSNCKRIDVIFDVYRDISIKSAERQLRGESDAITFKNLAAGQKVKQFKNFLQNGYNKTSLVKFVVEQWKEVSSRERLADKELHVTCGSHCYRISAEKVEEEEELRSEQEEADTRLLLHAQHAAAEKRFKSIIVSSEDTDVRVLCLAFSFSIDVPIYQRCISQMSARYVDIGKIACALGQDVCKALPGLHAFTGCDVVSAFAGIGKVKPLKKLLSKKEYHHAFQALGESWVISEDLMMKLEAFVCDIYGAKKGVSDVNQCRYAVFCAKKGEAESYQLPPCQDSLRKHCNRANYQAAVWRNSLRNNDVPSPVGHGWSLVKDEDQDKLVIDWMNGLPAPRAILELIACTCKKACKDDSCDCIRNGLKCTDLCRLTTCSNQQDEDDDLQAHLDEDDTEFD